MKWKDPRKSALPGWSNRKWMIKIWREIGLLDITEQKNCRSEQRLVYQTTMKVKLFSDSREMECSYQ